MQSLLMAERKKAKKDSSPEPSDQEVGTEPTRVSKEVFRILKWLKRLEKGKPSPAVLLDWAALDNLRLRFSPYEEQVKALEREEQGIEQKIEKLRNETKSAVPGLRSGEFPGRGKSGPPPS